MSSPTFGPSRQQRNVRGVLVVGYLAIVVLGWTTEFQPRLFWTVLLPILPISVVLGGFAGWRHICPLAFFGEIGRKLNRGAQRRVPRWLEQWFFVVTFIGLMAMLVLRLLATNGDGIWLAWTLIGLALAAIAVNWLFTGKTWCNFFCPVGLVERIYTEPRSLPTTPNSQCIRCTACKSSCPDIDPENAYWRDMMTSGRRIATYSFPGLVLGFYTYYWLRNGDWEAYFDGRWTRSPVSAELVLGPGLFFAPEIPALTAAILTLVCFSAASYLLLVVIEAIVRSLVQDEERRRHLMLALAAFSGFSAFYVFAGAPTLRGIPGGVGAMAFAAPMIGTLFLVNRWSRTREQFIRDRGAATLLRNWPFDEPPPSDVCEVYGMIKASEHAHEKNMAAYSSTVRELLANGLIRKGELQSLGELRRQLGISDREHDKLLARLSEEDLFVRESAAGVEERAQLEGYQTALTEALFHHAPETELEELRHAFGVDREIHEKLMDSMRGKSGVVIERAREQVRRVRGLRDDLESLAVPDPSEAEAFLSYLLLREQDEGIQGVLELLEYVGQPEVVRTLQPKLFSADTTTRGAAIRQLAKVCGEAEDLVREMEPWIMQRTPASPGRDPGALAEVLRRRATSSDHYVRAAVVWVAGGSDRPWAREIVSGAEDDPQLLVREAAGRLAHGRDAAPTTGRRFADLATLEKMHFMRGVTLFEELDPEDLHDLVQFVEEKSIAPGGVLCEEGDPDADDLFILLEGRASVVVRVQDSAGSAIDEREVAVLDVGEVVGEMSILDSSPRSATVRPKDGPIRVLRIPGQRFRSRLLPRSRVARPLLVTMARRIREMSRRVAGD